MTHQTNVHDACASDATVAISTKTNASLQGQKD
jgi:hypothetical protein